MGGPGPCEHGEPRETLPHHLQKTWSLQGTESREAGWGRGRE